MNKIAKHDTGDHPTCNTDADVGLTNSPTDGSMGRMSASSSLNCSVGGRLEFPMDMMTVSSPSEEEEEGDDNNNNNSSKLSPPSFPPLLTKFKNDGSFNSRHPRLPNMLPFEFRALEACLEAACNRLDVEVSQHCPGRSFRHNRSRS